jgi:hypothetical protein
MRNEHKILAGIPGGRYHLGDLGVNGRIILKHIFKEEGVRV